MLRSLLAAVVIVVPACSGGVAIEQPGPTARDPGADVGEDAGVAPGDEDPADPGDEDPVVPGDEDPDDDDDEPDDVDPDVDEGGDGDADPDGPIDPGCQPSCDGRACGDDGCGGACGACADAESCTSDGRCVGRPDGPVTMRFDIATANCPDGRWELGCPEDDPDLERCFCKPEFDGLNYGTQSHYVTVSSDRRRGDIWDMGNFQAVYVDDLNTDWTDGGASRAEAIFARAQDGFPTGVPQWFVLNEISAGRWPDDADYRRFVIDVARTLHEDHDKRVIVAAPFRRPGAHADDWAELADWAFVGAEVYLTGADVNASGNSVSWCEDEYQETIDAYDRLGVPLSRLVLFEHFGSSLAGTAWGRSGVSVNGWHNAIEARADAAASLGFAGFVSYSWAGNQMHETGANRRAFMDTYAGLTLP